MPLTKVLLLLFGAAGYQFSVSKQGTRQNSWELLRGVDVRPTLAWRSLSTLCDGLVWTTCLSTAILLYKDVWPSEAALYSFPRTSLNIAAFFCPAASTSYVDSAQIQAQLALISPSFVVGVAFACCGGLLRVVSSRTLGYMYNSSLELRPAHRLVTSGPYAYVRHPGYTGALLGIVGISLVNFAPGSWIRECGLLEESIAAASSRWILWTWVFLNIGRLVALSFSAATEDGVLGRKFGLEWKSWSWKVPRWFIPGLF